VQSPRKTSSHSRRIRLPREPEASARRTTQCPRHSARPGDRRVQVDGYRSLISSSVPTPSYGQIAEFYACDDSKEAFVKDFVDCMEQGDEP
jgi:hypothetical protein